MPMALTQFVDWYMAPVGQGDLASRSYLVSIACGACIRFPND